MIAFDSLKHSRYKSGTGDPVGDETPGSFSGLGWWWGDGFKCPGNVYTRCGFTRRGGGSPPSPKLELRIKCSWRKGEGSGKELNTGSETGFPRRAKRAGKIGVKHLVEDEIPTNH